MTNRVKYTKKGKLTEKEKVEIKRTSTYIFENRCTLCQVGKEGDNFQKDGKGVYVGESVRLLYEGSKEHKSDRRSELEESHQIKHWVLDHPDLDAPPTFKFKLIASFSGPLTRQLSEAVGIEKRGKHVLNSKSEYNRCRVPRLQIDYGRLEGREGEGEEGERGKGKEGEPRYRVVGSSRRRTGGC